MDIDSTKLTVFFEAPFWIGVFGRFTAYVRTTFRTHVRSDLSETHSIQPFPLGEPTTLCRPWG